MFRGKKTSREVSLYEPIGTDKEGMEIHLLDIIESGSADAADTCALKEDIAKLYALMESALSEQEYFVLKLRYGLYGELGIHTEKDREDGNQPLLCFPHRKKCPAKACRRCFLSP